MGQHQHLYNAAWRKGRAAHLHAHPLCRMHEALGRVVLAGVVDHIKPHRGDLVLFWDRANWQSLCKPCHDAHKQAQESTGLLRGAGLSGTPLDLAHPWHKPAAPAAGEGGVKSPQPPQAKPVGYLSSQRAITQGGGLADGKAS